MHKKIFITIFTLFLLFSLSAFADSIPQLILAGAEKEVLTETEYEETYEVLAYPGGDVDSTYGVCTDLVIRAFRNAGIDIQQLLHKDRVANKDAYPTEIWEYKKADKNIDHRRCQNLVVFFQRFAKEINKKLPSQWLPGDVIFFIRDTQEYPWHVGIISEVNDDSRKMYHLYPPNANEDDIDKYGGICGVFRWKTKR